MFNGYNCMKLISLLCKRINHLIFRFPSRQHTADNVGSMDISNLVIYSFFTWQITDVNCFPEKYRSMDMLD